MAKVRYVGPYDQIVVAEGHLPPGADTFARNEEREVPDSMVEGLCKGDFVEVTEPAWTPSTSSLSSDPISTDGGN